MAIRDRKASCEARKIVGAEKEEKKEEKKEENRRNFKINNDGKEKD